MPDSTGALTPTEASLSAFNAYYVLQGWTAYKTGSLTPGLENSRIIREQVAGSGEYSLRGAGIKISRGAGFTGVTGINVRSGIGYIVNFTYNRQRHVIVAARGTRPEMGAADLLTDIYVAPTSSFMDAGLVHRGFSITFNSIKEHLDGGHSVLENAQHIHCAGHSLGGAIVNLASYYLKSKYPDKTVHLYTFGAPRVGTYLGFPDALEKKLGTSNIYRVSHQLDPITMIPMFPFLHVLGNDNERNCLTISSPIQSADMENHSMSRYATRMKGKSWDQVRGMKHLPSFEDRMMKNAWERGGFSGAAKLAGGAIIWVLMKVLKSILKLLGGAVIMFVVTPLDLIARLLYMGVQGLGKLGGMVLEWITSAASALGLKVRNAADVTGAFLRNLLDRFGRAVVTAAEACLNGLVDLGGAYTQMYGLNMQGMYPM